MSRIFKTRWNKMLTKRQNLRASETSLNLTIDIDQVQLPVEIWDHIFSFLSENDVIALSSACVWFQQLVQRVKWSFNLEHNYHLNIDRLLNYTLSTTCNNVNISHCYWLKPGEILAIISRTKLQHFHLIDCNVNEDVMRAITSLNLESFSFTYAKKWSSYFEKHLEESAVFLQKLITLKILIKDEIFKDENSTNILLEVYANVLQHCEDLQDLKVGSAGQRYSETFIGPLHSIFALISQPFLSNLKRLVMRIDSYYLLQDVVDFIEAILKDKAIPLELVDFGQLNFYLFKKGIFHHPLILQENETLSLILNRNFSNLVNFLDDEVLICRKNYKTICLQNIKLEKFSDFADIIISKSGKSIKKLHLRECVMSENILNGIQSFALHCPQITELDLTIVNWIEKSGTRRNPWRTRLIFKLGPTLQLYNSAGMEKNEALLEVLTNFKNLKNLSISPSMLQCLYDSNTSVSEMPFWKVTKSCERLRELRILYQKSYDPYDVIHENSLYHIAHCKNLKVLELTGFCIRSNSKFLLSKITKGCPRLEELTIRWEYVLRKLQPIMQTSTIYNNSFNTLKNLKKLRVRNNCSIGSTSVISDLSRCKYLEKVDLRMDGDSTIRSLISALPKFEHLYLLSILMQGSKGIFELLCSTIQRIHDIKPAFDGIAYGPEDYFETAGCHLKLQDYF